MILERRLNGQRSSLVRLNQSEVPEVPPETNRSPEPSQRLAPPTKKFRLHLYNKTITPWFSHDELTWMVKKHEGRIVTIGVEDVDSE